MSLVDVGFFYGFDIPDHKKTLFLGKHGLAVLVFLIGRIGTNSHIEIAKLGGLLKELYMTGMKQVVTAADKDFFCHTMNQSNLGGFI